MDEEDYMLSYTKLIHFTLQHFYDIITNIVNPYYANYLIWTCPPLNLDKTIQS
jgi:hypothetical protein